VLDRLRAMTNARRAHRLLLLLVAVGLAAGCASGAGGATPTAGASAPAEAPPTGRLPGDPDAGVEAPPNGGGGQIGRPDGGEPVVPKPGQLLVHPVPVTSIEARVSGRHVVLNARWWSGVEPCAVLDSVAVARDGGAITITLLEGTSDVDAACIAIAVEKVTVIDIGELEPGTYTIVADPGDALAVTITVS
jgi:hypothetical protein